MHVVQTRDSTARTIVRKLLAITRSKGTLGMRLANADRRLSRAVVALLLYLALKSAARYAALLLKLLPWFVVFVQLRIIEPIPPLATVHGAEIRMPMCYEATAAARLIRSERRRPWRRAEWKREDGGEAVQNRYQVHAAAIRAAFPLLERSPGTLRVHKK